MTKPTRVVVTDGIEVVADLLTDTRAEELAGYVVIGLMADGLGFKIASNAGSDVDEVAIIATVLEQLHRNLTEPG